MAWAARRGVECLVDPRAALALFGAGVLWTVANWMTGWLLLGPALVVLFRLALEILRGRDPSPWPDPRALLRDLPAALMAGIVFVLPFRAWGFAEQTNDALEALVQAAAHLLKDSPTAAAFSPSLPGIPLVASAALFVHFAFHVFVFALLAEGKGGLVASVRESWRIAEMPVRATGTSGLARHAAYTSLVLLALLVAARFYYLHYTAGWLFTSLVGPLAVLLLAAWYLELTGEPAPRLPAEAPVDVE